MTAQMCKQWDIVDTRSFIGEKHYKKGIRRMTDALASFLWDCVWRYFFSTHLTLWPRPLGCSSLTISGQVCVITLHLPLVTVVVVSPSQK